MTKNCKYIQKIIYFVIKRNDYWVFKRYLSPAHIELKTNMKLFGYGTCVIIPIKSRSFTILAFTHLNVWNISLVWTGQERTEATTCK